MLKILSLIATDSDEYFQAAVTVLERQHNGVELVGVTAASPIDLKQDGKSVPFIPLDKVTAWGGYMTFCSSSARNLSA